MPELQGIERRPTHAVNVAGVCVGGEAAVVVQSMTNTDTADVAATAKTGRRAVAGRFRTGADHGEYLRGRRRGAASATVWR